MQRGAVACMVGVVLSPQVAVLPFPWALLVTQVCACCCLLWSPSLPAPGVSLNRSLSRLSLSSARARGQWERRGGEETWLGGLALGTQGACAAKCCLLWDVWIAGGLRLAVGCFLWCPLRYLCQASVNLWCCSLGTNALLQACSSCSCYNDIS